jgi:taurine--2-oxoglutarate transaminase
MFAEESEALGGEHLMHYEEIDRRRLLHPWSVQSKYQPELIIRAEGNYYWDSKGRRYLDFASQLGYANIGHGDTRVARALDEETWSVASIYGSGKLPTLRLAEKLLSLFPNSYERVFFGLNGSDAVEASLKIARLVTGRPEVIAFHHAYHGSSAGAMSVGGLSRLRVMPEVPGTIHVYPPYHYRSPVAGRTQEETDEHTVEYLRRTIDARGHENIAAVIGEPVMGSGVGVVPGQRYWRLVSELCSEYGLLLIADEVITGFGRLGYWFARDYYDYLPDIITLGKGLTSGYLPLSAAVLGEKVCRPLEDRYLPHGLTNANHAVCSAAALANITVIEEDDLITNAMTRGGELGKGMMDLAARHACVGDVRHLGLFSVIELVQDPESKSKFPTGTRLADGRYGEDDVAVQVRNAMYGRGIRITAFRTGGIVALVPPLRIEEHEIDRALGALDEVLAMVDVLVDSASRRAPR